MDPVYGAGQPENALTGTVFGVEGSGTIQVPYDFSNFRFWHGTDIANLQPGEVGTLVPDTLGYEFDIDADNGFRPAGLIDLSSTTLQVDEKLLDYGGTFGPGVATHSLTLYRADSGALVFSAGSVYWTWGLDSNHDYRTLNANNPDPVTYIPADPNVQQAMVNLFADMGVQPETLMASLMLATQSTDTIAPTTTIGAINDSGGGTLSITGTAQDSGGGVVAGVEVSIDGGTSWHHAVGFESWSFNWTPATSGTYSIMARAVDDSVNLGQPSGVSVLVAAVPENNTVVATITAADDPGLFAADNAVGLLAVADAAPVDTFSIAGGADAALFAIDSATGVLSFLTPPDFEHPQDAGGDNLYEVTIQVFDGTVTHTQNVVVDVTNVDPEGVIGDARDNTFIAGADKEGFVGQGGSDTVSYALAPTGVTASLIKPSTNTGFAAGDTYNSIENLIGSAFNDSLTGDNGNNVLEGGPGADRLDGGKGTNTASYQHATAGVIADLTSPQNNTGEAAGDTYTGIENLRGSQFGDQLIGDKYNNVLMGDGGVDFLDGRQGADIMIGGAGNDTYVVDNKGDIVDEASMGGDGTDTVFASTNFSLSDPVHALGSIENLILIGTTKSNLVGTGNELDNIIVGDAGNNVLAGLGGADTMDGGAGIDTASYAASPAGVNVSLTTGVASGGDAEGDQLANFENLTGSNFDDTLEGDVGNNVLIGGLNGPAGDTVSYALAPSGLNGVGVTVNLGTTKAQNTVTAGTDTLNGFENLIGSEFNDTLTGNSGNNVLTGLGGDDRLDGGKGADHMIGGTGNDTYIVDNVGDLVDETNGDGIDTVQTSISFNLQDVTQALGAIENLILTGKSSISGVANDLDNILIGNDGNNVLWGLGGNDYIDGGKGADIMIGANGNDTYVVDNKGDIVDEAIGGDGIDTVLSSVNFSFVDPAHALGSLENLTLTGKSSISGTGNELDNVIVGNTGNNVLAGLGGADTLDGGGGTDTATYAASAAGVNVSLATGLGTGGDAEGDHLFNIQNLTGSNFDDTLEGNAGNNVLVGGLNGIGGDTVSYEHAGPGLNGVGVTVSLATTKAQNTVTAGTDSLSGFENLTGSEFNDTLTGSSGDNVLSGHAGNDVLNGGSGNDTLIGGLGADILNGGSGRDVFVYNSAQEGGDLIQSFSVTDDTLSFSASGFGGGLVAGQHLVSGTTLMAEAAPAATTNAGTFLYDTSTHDLLWDADGTGGGAAVQIAHFDTAVTLTPDHFDITA